MQARSDSGAQVGLMQSRGERSVDLLLSAETSEPVEALCLTLAAGRNGLSFPSASSSLSPSLSLPLPLSSGCSWPASPLDTSLSALPVELLPLGHAFSGTTVNLIKYPSSLISCAFLHHKKVTFPHICVVVVFGLFCSVQTAVPVLHAGTLGLAVNLIM